LFLSQFVTALDVGAIVSKFATFDERSAALEAQARHAFEEMPASERRSFEIVHCGRDGEGVAGAFGVGVLSWSPTIGWTRTRPPTPAVSSALVLSTGSGTPTVASWLAHWEASPAAGTSRAVFSAFVDAVGS